MVNSFTIEANVHAFIKRKKTFFVLTGTNFTNKALGDAENTCDDVTLELTELVLQVREQNTGVDVEKILE